MKWQEIRKHYRFSIADCRFAIAPFIGGVT